MSGRLVRRPLPGRPGDEDPQEVEKDEGNSDKALSHHIGGGRNQGGDHKRDHHKVSKASQKKLGSHQTETGEEEDENREFKGQSDSQENLRRQGEVLADGQDRSKVSADLEKETARQGKDDGVAEEASRQKEKSPKEDERESPPLLPRLKAWRDKAPELVKEEGGSGEEGGEKRELDVHHEGFGQRGEGQLTPTLHELRQGPCEEEVELPVVVPTA